MSRQQTRAETSSGNPDGVEARIVELSLQHPDFGAQRLAPLLEAESIQTAAPRLPPEPPAAFASDFAKEVVTPEEQPRPVLPACADEAPSARVVPVPKRPVKTSFQGAGALTLLNVVLLALLAYLGFHTTQNLRLAAAEPQAAPAAVVPAVVAAAEPQGDAPPLEGYRTIWERNLFGAPGEQAPVQPKEIAVEKLALAGKDLGLKLMGTVVADDARLRRAFIDNSKTGKQEAFREGDTAGAVRIKKILRNKVIIATREGDRVLSADVFGTGRQAAVSAPPQPAVASSPFAQAAGGSGKPEVGIIEASLKRAQVESGLSEDDHLMKQVRVFPYTDAQGVPQGGFRLSYLMAGNVLVQMGLRSGDVILGVNGEAVVGPDDAAGFFEKLAQGGDVTIQAMRRGRPVQLQLKIE